MPLTVPEMRDAIIGDNSKERSAFLAAFSRNLGPIVCEATKAHHALDRMISIAEPTDRMRRICMFLHAALNSAVSSTSLLVEGYPLPSGHMMRHYAEAIAMAMMCADVEGRVLEVFDGDPRRYPVHKSLERLQRRGIARRLRSLLGFDPSRWREFIAISRFYDQHSHASALSMAFHFTLGSTEELIVGAHFDPAKRRPFSLELKRRRTAFRVLKELTRILSHVLPPKKRSKSSRRPQNRRAKPRANGEADAD